MLCWNRASRVSVLALSLELFAEPGAARASDDAPEDARCLADAEHVIVYSEPGRFGGWPANHGIWSWGDEIVVGFSAGYYKDRGPGLHSIDHDRPEEHLLARSTDGGRTWSVENPGKAGVLVPQGRALHGTPVPGLVEKEPIDCLGGIDFTHPDFAMTLRMSDVHAGTSRFYWSADRARTWKGPFRLPLFGQKGIAARTAYLVSGPSDAMLFLTASKSNGREGRPLSARTTDGGRSWRFVSWIGPEPEGFAIMPASVRLGPRELLVAVRRREGPRRWIDLHRSLDGGRSWELEEPPVKSTGAGNPPSMVRLKDGRIALVWGYRAPPFSIRARLSADGGRTWGEVLALRSDGGNQDIGYPRTVERPDGKLITVYYFNVDPKKDRFIGATIWEP